MQIYTFCRNSQISFLYYCRVSHNFGTSCLLSHIDTTTKSLVSHKFPRFSIINSQDFQLMIPFPLFELEKSTVFFQLAVVFPNLFHFILKFSKILSPPLREEPRFSRHITPLPTHIVQPNGSTMCQSLPRSLSIVIRTIFFLLLALYFLQGRYNILIDPFLNLK